MSWRTAWLNLSDLRHIAVTASVDGYSVDPTDLCDRVNGRPVEGGYGANVAEKLVRQFGMSYSEAQGYIEGALGIEVGS